MVFNYVPNKFILYILTAMIAVELKKSKFKSI